MKFKKSTGLLLGKFMPPHLGHQYIVDFARNYVDELIVVIGIRPEDPIQGNLRSQWLNEMIPSTKIIQVIDKNPVETHPQYWNIWEKTLRNALPYIPDYLFASEDYGWKLAEVMQMKYIPVNHSRNLVPISATLIRNQPLKYWEYLPLAVKPYYVKKVCIYGPESTGKTILTQKLAKHYQTAYCEEYARGLIDFSNGKVVYGDIEKIARGHKASEASLSRQSNRILFSDTDAIITTIWSEVLFHKIPKWVIDESNRCRYDLYLLTDIDTPWVEDCQRYLPHKRKWFLNRCIQELKKRNIDYKLITGSWNKRFDLAVSYINPLLK
jgi:HTH-type transcriptional regulator, transcriptional repressor of NAD biosynthesis genes